MSEYASATIAKHNRRVPLMMSSGGAPIVFCFAFAKQPSIL